MKKIKIDLKNDEIHKIINGLFCLRQKYVELNHLTFIDETSNVNKPIINEVNKIDALLSRFENLLTEFEN